MPSLDLEPVATGKLDLEPVHNLELEPVEAKSTPSLSPSIDLPGQSTGGIATAQDYKLSPINPLDQNRVRSIFSRSAADDPINAHPTELGPPAIIDFDSSTRLPRTTGPELKAAFPFLSDTWANRIAGLQRGVVSGAESFTSPEMMGLGTVGAAPKAFQEALGYLFAGPMAEEILPSINRAIDAAKAGKDEEAGSEIANALQNAVLAGTIASHGLGDKVGNFEAARKDFDFLPGPAADVAAGLIARTEGMRDKPAIVQKDIPDASQSVNTPQPPSETVSPAPLDLTPIEEPPKIVGMGGAVPSEFDKADNGPTATKYRLIDEQRQERGLEPILKPERISDQITLDRAKAIVDENPNKADELISELNNKARPISDTENHILLMREIDYRGEYDKALNEAAQADDDGRPEDVVAANVRADMWSDKMTELEQAARKAGTELGRGLRARQVMFNDDMSLAGLELRMRKSNAWRPLTEEERSSLKQIADDYKVKADALEQRNAELQSQQAETAMQLAHERLMAEEKAKTAPSKYILSIAEKIGARLKSAADESRQYLAGKAFTLSPDVLYHISRVGADNIYSIGLDFAKWSARMVEDIGEKVKPHLQTVWDASQKLIDAETERAPEKVRETVRNVVKKQSEMDTSEKQADLKAKISERLKDGQGEDISGFVQKLARTFVEQGIKDREGLIDAVHGVLKEIDPEITRRDAMDAISGYGDYKQLTKDQISIQLRDIKGQMQQIGKLEDMQAGQAPQKTGVERRRPSDEERRLIKQVEEAKKKGGYIVTDPETQLRSSLQSIKTRLENQIKDLQHEIDTKTRTVKSKTDQPTSPEIEALKKTRDALKEEHAKVFGDKELTDEQRVKMAMAAVEKSIAEYDRRIKANELVTPKKVSKTPVTPELEAVRAKRDALKAQLDEMRDADSGLQEKKAREAIEAQKRALEKSIAEQERKLRENDLSSKGKPVNRPADPELEPLKQRRDELNRQLAESRKMPEDEKLAREMARRLESLNKEIAKKEAKISAGDLSPEIVPKVNRPLSPELEKAKQRLEGLNKELDQLRNPQKTKEEIALKAFKTRTAKRIEELTQRLADENYTPKAKPPSVPFDSEATKLKADLAHIKDDFETAREKDRLANREWWQKLGDAFVKVERGFKLSSIQVFGKLTVAALTRGVTTATEEAVGGAAGLVPGISKVAGQAPREGGLNVKAMARAFAAGITKGITDAAETAKRGTTDLEAANGKKVDKDWSNFLGRVHGMFKAPIKRAEFTLALEKRTQFALEHGVDITDPLVQARFISESIDDGYRSIFMQHGFASDMFNQLTSQMAKSKKYPVMGELSADVLRFLMPIVRVPMNIVGETATGVHGSFTASARLLFHAVNGTLDKLDPEVADSIMRQFKKGSIGLGLIAIGYFNPQAVGGYDWREKRKAGAVKTGQFQVNGVNLWNVLHAPWFNLMQIGATIRHVKDEHVHGGEKGITEGMWAAGLGLVDQTPFWHEMINVGSIQESQSRRNAFFGELAKGTIVPQAIQWAAKQTDKDSQGNLVTRKPGTFMEHIKTGVPGLREQVPVKHVKP